MESHTNKGNKNLISLLAGPLMFVVAVLLLPGDVFSTTSSAAIGTLIWMGIWWANLPVEIGVTAFVPILVNLFFQLIPMDELLRKYATETFVLLLGADIIALYWNKVGLDKRIAISSLVLIGPSLGQQIIVWFSASAFLSMFLPNLAVCAMLTPIAFSMIKSAGENDCSKSTAGAFILCSIAWGCGIGGLGTPIGGAMNLVAIEYLEDLIGKEFLYIDWAVRFIPFLILLLVGNLIVLMLLKPKGAKLPRSREFFRSTYNELPPMSRYEKIGLLLFALMIILPFARPLYVDLIPNLKPAYVFILLAFSVFFIPAEDGKPLLSWTEAFKEVYWGILFMISSGLAVGYLITETGAANEFASLLTSFRLSGGFGMILAIVTFTVLLAESSNNTSAAAISVPIVISFTKVLNLNPIPYVFITIAAFNSAYMLPTTVRSIPIGYGVPTKFLLKKGFLLTATTIILISVIGYLFMLLIPGFSILSLIEPITTKI